MLTAIPKEELPTRGGRPRSPMREFVASTLEEFLAASAPGDFFEVSGWPDPDGLGGAAAATKARAELANEAFRRGVREEVKVSRSGARVFLERKEKWVAPRPMPEARLYRAN